MCQIQVLKSNNNNDNLQFYYLYINFVINKYSHTNNLSYQNRHYTRQQRCLSEHKQVLCQLQPWLLSGPSYSLLSPDLIGPHYQPNILSCISLAATTSSQSTDQLGLDIPVSLPGMVAAVQFNIIVNRPLKSSSQQQSLKLYTIPIAA